MPCAASARISPCLHLRTCTPNSNEASGLLSVQELQDMISSLEERVHLSSHTIHGTGIDLPTFGWFLWYSSMYSKYTFVPWMPWVFLYVPLWRWFPTNVSSDDGKHVVFWFFLCGKKFPRSFSSFVGGPASDRSETVASLISSQRIIPLAKTSGDDLRLGWIGAYKESNLLFRHHRPSRCKKNGTSFDVDMKITLLQMKISGSTEFIFFFGSFVACCCQELCWLQPGLELFCILFRTHATWIEELSSWWFQIFYIFPEPKGEMIQLYPIRFIFFGWVDKNHQRLMSYSFWKTGCFWYPPQKTSEDDPTKLEKENHVQ